MWLLWSWTSITIIQGSSWVYSILLKIWCLIKDGMQISWIFFLMFVNFRMFNTDESVTGCVIEDLCVWCEIRQFVISYDLHAQGRNKLEILQSIEILNISNLWFMYIGCKFYKKMCDCFCYTHEDNLVIFQFWLEKKSL
jgi:hypothetical protein